MEATPTYVFAHGQSPVVETNVYYGQQCKRKLLCETVLAQLSHPVTPEKIKEMLHSEGIFWKPQEGIATMHTVILDLHQKTVYITEGQGAIQKATFL